MTASTSTAAERFAQPINVTDLDTVFPGDVRLLMPTYDEIPEEFRDWNKHGPWQRWQSTWFFKGLPTEATPTPKPGIDLSAALRHLAAIQRSFQPRHEHKEAAVAWLASLWFEPLTEAQLVCLLKM